jgi:anaerobic selenocysteine-containing dehydrogenase
VVSPIYTSAVNNTFVKPSYEEFNRTGTLDFVIPRGKSIIGMKEFNALGKLKNSTGVVNFWQPLWGKINPRTNNGKAAGAAKYDNPWGLIYDGFRNPTASYQPNIEGYENFFDNKNPRTGSFTGYLSPFNYDSGTSFAQTGWHRRYKLLYMTNKARNRAHTVFDNTAIIKDQFTQCVFINPLDANARGINDGDMVYAYNDRGCTYLPAKVTHYIIPGLISIEHGAWYRPGSETVTVMQDFGVDPTDGETPVFTKITVPVDIGGCENVLTLGIGTAEHYCGQAVSAHGGPCEVSKTRPAETNF